MYCNVLLYYIENFTLKTISKQLPACSSASTLCDILFSASGLAYTVASTVGHWPHLPSQRRSAATILHPLTTLWCDMVPVAADFRLKSPSFHGEPEKLATFRQWRNSCVRCSDCQWRALATSSGHLVIGLLPWHRPTVAQYTTISCSEI